MKGKFVCLLMIVTNAMQRESAIADDYWWENLKRGKKNQTEVTLGNIERQ